MESLIYFIFGATVVASIWLFRTKKLSFLNQNESHYNQGWGFFGLLYFFIHAGQSPEEKIQIFYITILP